MALLDIINWEIFTQEEKNNLKRMIKSGHITGLTQAVPAMNKEKELELQKIVDYMRPIADGFKSKVREQIEKDGHPETPEEEAVIQKEMEREYREYAEEQELKALKRRAGMKDKTAKDEYEKMKEDIALRKQDEKETNKQNKKDTEKRKEQDKEKQDVIDMGFKERRIKQDETENGVIIKPIKIEEEKKTK